MNKWVRVWHVVIIQHMVALFIHIIVVALLLCYFFPLCHPGCLCWENWRAETNQKKSMNFKWLQRVKTSLLGVNTRKHTHAHTRTPTLFLQQEEVGEDSFLVAAPGHSAVPDGCRLLVCCPVWAGSLFAGTKQKVDEAWAGRRLE